MFIKIVLLFAGLCLSAAAQDTEKLREQLKEVQKRKPTAMHHKWPALAQGPENYLKRKIDKAEKQKKLEKKDQKSK
jgi:hypothetical protein